MLVYSKLKLLGLKIFKIVKYLKNNNLNQDKMRKTSQIMLLKVNLLKKGSLK